MNSRPRLLLVHLIGLALVAAAWWAGWATFLLEQDRVHVMPIAAGVVALAFCFGWFGKWHDVKLIADLAPACALVGTMVGALIVVPEIINNAPFEVRQAHLIQALTANGMGAMIYVWLTFCERVCKTHA